LEALDDLACVYRVSLFDNGIHGQRKARDYRIKLARARPVRSCAVHRARRGNC
jgi:hypothetical protein